MSKDFYNGCLNDLLNASMETKFIRLFDAHHYERDKPNNPNYVAVENYLTQRLKAEAQAQVLGAQVGGVLKVPGKPSKM